MRHSEHLEVVADECSDLYGVVPWEGEIVPLLEHNRLFSITLDNLAYIDRVRAVRPWAQFTVTADGRVELDTGDLIQ